MAIRRGTPWNLSRLWRDRLNKIRPLAVAAREFAINCSRKPNVIATTSVKNHHSTTSTGVAFACDLFELAIVLLIYLGLVARLIPPDGQSWKVANLLLLPSEGLVVMFLVFRRRAEQMSLRWQDWLLA